MSTSDKRPNGNSTEHLSLPFTPRVLLARDQYEPDPEHKDPALVLKHIAWGMFLAGIAFLVLAWILPSLKPTSTPNTKNYGVISR